MAVILIAAAISTPFIFFLDFPSDNRCVDLSLTYKHYQSSYTSQSGWSSTEELTVLTYSVSLNNVSDVLSGESFGGYPLWLNVSTWDVNDAVNIGSTEGIVVGELSLYSYDCWKVELDEDTAVFYDKELGIFTQSSWYQTGSTGFMQMWTENDQYSLTSENFDSFDAVFVTRDGVLISGILTQVSIILVILEYRRSRASSI